MSKGKVLVAMSGGVDSSVAAYLLKEEGYEVLGATIQTWASKDCDKLNTRACCSIDGVDDARSVADKLDIPYFVFNMEKEFKEAVVDYFTREYLNARTPNPCIACNERIKFRLFRQRGMAMDVDFIATGHYAQVLRDEATGYYQVHEAADPSKDQSYVLFSQSQEELAHLKLPLGSWLKKDAREAAKKMGLRVFDKPDSQEICFIPSNDYKTFIKKEKDLADLPGFIKNRAGKVLGEHTGYFNFTVGQRRGLGIAYAEPLYVIHIDKDKNEVIVGNKEEVRTQRFVVENPTWMIPLDDHRERECEIKIRSQHAKSGGLIRRNEDGTVTASFYIPQDAITPGQAAVFYEGPKVIGGGWIKNVMWQETAAQPAVTG